MTEQFKLELELNTESMQMLFGDFDKYIKKLEDDLSVDVIDRDGVIKITGEEKNVKRARNLILDLISDMLISGKYSHQLPTSDLKLFMNAIASIAIIGWI